MTLALAPATQAAVAIAGTPASRVVILANATQPESVQLARHYAQARGVPEANIVALPLPAGETIPWTEFTGTLWQPLQDELVRRGWINATEREGRDAAGRKRLGANGHRIAFLVVCRGVPLRIDHDAARYAETPLTAANERVRTNQASVDSELATLAQDDPVFNGFIPNPLFRKANATAADLGQVIKVSRLDGPDFAAARALVDQAIEGERTGLLGRAYVDLGGPYPEGDRWLAEVAGTLAGTGFDTEVERGPGTIEAGARFDAPVLYFGWYSGSLDGPMAAEGFRFPAGAVALHIHSFSAGTLRSPTEGWVGPLVARGVTATVGNVFEPFLELTHDPRALLAVLRAGGMFGDAVAASQPALSWQTIAVGDPLYRPFAVSLEEQLARRATLPAGRVVYAVLRQAHRLEATGREAEALELLRREAAARPSAVLAIALAERLEAAGVRPEARAALAALELSPFGAGDWGTLRQVIRKLAQLEAPGMARSLAQRLLDEPTLPPVWRARLTQELTDLPASEPLN